MDPWATTRYAAIGIIAVGAVLTVGYALSSAPDLPALELDTVSSDWNDAVRRLNIEPIYPPQEDIYVGDIYASITRGDRNFQGKSIKLWHVDMSDAITRTYDNVPVFPKTLPPPLKEGDMWPQDSSDTLFSNGQRKSLSLVAFPRFLVRHARQASGGIFSGPGMLGQIGGVFGVSGSSDEIEELYFPGAETYGVNALEASAALALFCESEQNLPICTENGVRQMLSMQVGDEIWKQERDQAGKLTGRYAMGVELILVNQVFLTRSIVRSHSTDQGKAITASLATKLQELQQSAPPPNLPAPSAPKVDEPATTGAVSAATKSALEIQQLQIAQLKLELEKLQSGGAGASLLAASASGSRIALNQTFPRPIVVGVRAVRRVPTVSPDAANAKLP